MPLIGTHRIRTARGSRSLGHQPLASFFRAPPPPMLLLLLLLTLPTTLQAQRNRC
jgi:hypothetical protein